jgi:hypothetical protein
VATADSSGFIGTESQEELLRVPVISEGLSRDLDQLGGLFDLYPSEGVPGETNFVAFHDFLHKPAGSCLYSEIVFAVDYSWRLIRRSISASGMLRFLVPLSNATELVVQFEVRCGATSFTGYRSARLLRKEISILNATVDFALLEQIVFAGYSFYESLLNP